MPAVALYRRGPRWEDSRPLGEQAGIMEHVAYLTALVHEGAVERAGAFHAFADLVEDDLLGLVLFAEHVDGARERLVHDPALSSGVMRADVRAWHV